MLFQTEEPIISKLSKKSTSLFLDFRHSVFWRLVLCTVLHGRCSYHGSTPSLNGEGQETPSVRSDGSVAAWSKEGALRGKKENQSTYSG